MIKTIHLLLLFLLVSTLSKAQPINITGTWELTEFTYGNNPTVKSEKSGFKKIKLITDTHFTVIETQAGANITTTSIFGNYTLNDGTYTENIEHVNQESRGMIGATFSFNVKIDDEGRMIQIGSFNGINAHEVWTRVATKADSNSAIKTPALTSARYIIEHDGQKVEFISKKKKLLSIIPPTSIESVKVIKDQEIIKKLYGGAANGIVIIKIKDGEWLSFEKELQENGDFKEVLSK
jgi:hypothetical protein